MLPYFAGECASRFPTMVFHKYTCTALSVELLDDVRKKYALLEVLPLAMCHELSERL